jgi:hypothetical protein
MDDGEEDQDEYVHPDWTHWLQLETMTLKEAISLSINVDPCTVRIASNKVYIETAADLSRPMARYSLSIRPAPNEFCLRWDLAFRSIAISLPAVNLPAHRDRGDQPLIEATVFVAWALEKGWKIPTDLRQLAAHDKPLRSSSGSPPQAPTRPASNLRPFWVDAEKAIMAWLEENGCPTAGDGNQAVLERYAQEWLAGHGHEIPSPSTLRRHVRDCIERRRKELANL